MAINQGNNNKYYDLDIYIIGPNILDSGHVLDLLIKTTNEVIVIGDGTTDILVKTDDQFIGEFLSVFSQLNFKSHFAPKQILVFIHAHSAIDKPDIIVKDDIIIVLIITLFTINYLSTGFFYF